MKRDDLTGFELSGNKVRKLEFHFAAAVAEGADTVITCGALQSNHSRATAFAAARLGMRCILLLRTSHDSASPPLSGNYLLHHLGGAEIRLMAPEQWPLRDELMATVAQEQTCAGHRSWVIPEGASDALGMWGFVVAMRELRDQIATVGGRPPVIWHAASSGGTTAGIGWGVDRFGLATPVVACSIGDRSEDLAAKVYSIWEEAAATMNAPPPDLAIDYVDRHVGGGYGVITSDELAIQAEASALTGVIFDPTYTGKAIAGLHRDIATGRYDRNDNVVFWHTGGGFAALSYDFTGIVAAAGRVADTA
jgi:D-cysteine desulfhydrase